MTDYLSLAKAGVVLLHVITATSAMFRRQEYGVAGLRVLPSRHAVLWINVCSWLLMLATLLVAPAAGLGFVYLGAASLLGLGFLYLAMRLWRGKAPQPARQLYLYSVIYVTALFGAMVADRLLSLFLR